jgi:SAM-dependent methyltransferase
VRDPRRTTALGRLLGYPPRFVVRHPLRAARNAIGNHPSAFADAHLLGLDGLEIGGAAHNDFRLARVNADRAPDASTLAAQRALTGRALPVDVVADGAALPLEDGSFDFVLASHVVEHMPDPIAALLEWGRVARRHVLVVVPRRDNPFDRDRPLTGFEELADRFLSRTDAAGDRHWSVWTPETFAEHCGRIGLPVEAVQDPDDKRGNGFAVLLDSRGVHRGSADALRERLAAGAA